MRTALSVFLMVLWAGPGLAADVTLTPVTVSVPGGLAGVALGGAYGRDVIVRSRKGTHHRLTLDKDGKPVLTPETIIPSTFTPRGQTLPDGEVVLGKENIESVWLVGPTERYKHGVLGDHIEASGIRATLGDLMVVQLTLEEDSVFEDRYPRLADVDGDGKDEIIVVRSYLDKGSALAILKADMQGMRIVAQSAPMGKANRWLNPIGAADFDGDGRVEIAAVLTPHTGGTLALYEYDKGAMREDRRLEGFSNHEIGSRELGLSAILDANGDSVPDLLLPDNDRTSLKVITFKDGTAKELASLKHTSPIVTSFVVSDLNGDGREDVVYGLEDGTVVAALLTLQ